MPAQAQCTGRPAELVLGRAVLGLGLRLVLAIADFLFVPGNLALKLVQTKVDASVNVRTGTAAYKALVPIRLDNNLYVIVDALLGYNNIDGLYFIEKLLQLGSFGPGIILHILGKMQMTSTNGYLHYHILEKKN